MKKICEVLTFSVIIFLFLFCVVSAANAQEKSQKIISVGTNPIGTFFHVTGVAAAKTITDHTTMKALVKPMAGPVAWYPYMERGDIDLGVLNMWDAEKGYLGESLYEKLSNKKGFSIRLVCATVPNAIGLMVAKDSPVKTVSDLKGKKVAGNFPTPSQKLQTEALLANGGLTWKDVITVPANSPADGIKLVMEGRADSSGTITLGTPIIDELNAKKGARYLPLNPSSDVVAKMKQIFPGYMVKVLPGPGKTGIEKEQYLWGYDIYLIAGEKVSEETIYTVIKALWENYKEFEGVYKPLVDWTPKTFVTKEALIPYHPGAIRFYKEKGVWTPELEALQKSLLAKKR